MMKNISRQICLLLLLTAIGIKTYAQQPQIEYLDQGSKLTGYPKVKWLKGEPVTAFKKDKIYIVELWATWCGPCIAAMPHLNELYNKFKDKNVVVIAQDVMDNDQVKVEQFVKQQGDKMAFSVASDGNKGSDFYRKWMLGAGVSDIPQTFIIQNNTLLWQTRPSMLNDEMMQLLIDGKFTVAAAEAIAKKHQ